MGMMKLDKDATAAKSEKGLIGVYCMNDKSCKIWVKEFDAGKIKALRLPKKCPNPLVEAGRMKNSKEPTKFDEPAVDKATEMALSLGMAMAETKKDATEAEANAKPTDANPATTEAKPSESAEAEPPKPEKRPREETTSCEDAPPAKKAKVAEEQA